MLIKTKNKAVRCTKRLISFIKTKIESKNENPKLKAQEKLDKTPPKIWFAPNFYRKTLHVKHRKRQVLVLNKTVTKYTDYKNSVQTKRYRN